MIALASGLRVYLACGVTDMREGMTGLAMLVQQGLSADPFDGVKRHREPIRRVASSRIVTEHFRVAIRGHSARGGHDIRRSPCHGH